MNILDLLCNVMTLTLHVATFQRRDVSTFRRHFDPPLERHDVGYKRRDIEFKSLWNVATLIFNVATSILTTLWNVVTLISNVATLIFAPLWNVATLISNVATLVITILWNVATLPCLRPKTPSFFLFYPTPLLLNPSFPVQLSTLTLAGVPNTPVGGQYTALQHPLCAPPSLSTPSHTQSTVRASHSHLGVLARD